MPKITLLGAINVLLALSFGFILATNGTSFTLSWATFIHMYLPDSILVIAIGINAFSAYKQFGEEKINNQGFGIATAGTVFWVFLLAVGDLLASSFLSSIILIILVAISLYFFLKMLPKKYALTLTCISLLVGVIGIISGFEEEYCWSIGAKADPTGAKMVPASKEDMREFGVTEKIGVAFRAHMLCHKTFNLSQAIKESYFPQ